MKNLAIVVVALGMVACNTNHPNVIDSNVGNDAAVTVPDTGVMMHPDTGSSCGPLMGMAVAGAVCQHSTLTCLMGATTQAAQMACINADPMAQNCDACIQQDLLHSCTTMGSCAQANGTLACCAMTACPTGDQTCLMMAEGMGGACGTQVQALVTCINNGEMAQACGVTMACFM